MNASVPTPPGMAHIWVSWHVGADEFDALVGDAEVREITTGAFRPFRAADIEVDGQPVKLFGDYQERSVTVSVDAWTADGDVSGAR